MLEQNSNGIILSVHAQPGAKKNEIRGPQADALKVCVCAAPEKGKANSAIIELLAKSLGLKKSQIEILSGETSRKKRFLITDITLDELTRKANDSGISGLVEN